MMNRAFAYMLLGLSGAAADAAQPPDVACLVLEDGYWQAAELDVKTGKTRVLTRSPVDKARISWFPDGKLLVSRNDGTLSVLDTSNGSESVVTIEQKPVVDAAVSPNGLLVAFSFSTAIDGNDIWVIGWPTRKVERVVRMPHLQHEPTWSADGSTVYFLSGDGGQAHDIWQYKPDSDAKEQVTVGELYHFDVAVSPKGELAYSSNRDGNYELYLRGKSGKAERLTDDPALDARPEFSPDGRSILFESSRSGTMQIHRLDLKSKRVSPVTTAPGGARQPIWRGRAS
jgi:TolB protein